MKGYLLALALVTIMMSIQLYCEHKEIKYYKEIADSNKRNFNETCEQLKKLYNNNEYLQEQLRLLREKIGNTTKDKQWYNVSVYYKDIGECRFMFEWDNATFKEVIQSINSAIQDKRYSITLIDGSGNSATVNPKEALYIRTEKVNA